MLVLDGGHVRPETEAEYARRMESKVERLHYFARLDERAAASQLAASRPVKTVPPAPAKPAAPRRASTAVRPAPQRRGATHCPGCGKPFKRGGDVAPGAVRYARDGLCGRCLTARDGRPTHRRQRPERCEECGHPMRGSNERADAKPGTRQYAGGGLCTTCFTRHRRRK